MRILRPQEIHLLRRGCPVIPANFGDSDSQANQTSTTNNTNYVTSTDRRVVASDAAIALSGDGNLVQKTESTSFTDLSNRSTNFTDSSNRSTNFTDNSDRSTTVKNTTTDFGAVQAALTGMDRVSKSAIGLSDTTVSGAIGVLTKASEQNYQMAMTAFNAAGATRAVAAESMQGVMDFANKNTLLSSQAFEESKFGPDQSKMVLYVALGVIGLVAATHVFK